jgi:hypothetical protein
MAHTFSTSNTTTTFEFLDEDSVSERRPIYAPLQERGKFSGYSVTLMCVTWSSYMYVFCG